MTAPAPRIHLMHGMKRSGNHALANWLLPQLGGACFNNVVPLGDVLRGAAIPAPRPFADWRREHAAAAGGAAGAGDAADAPADASANVLVTLEDHALRLTPFVEAAARNLLVLRRPRPLFSSRLRKAFQVDMPAYPRGNDAVMQRAVALWKQHARCFLGDAREFPGRVAILFDAWVADAAYRAAISAALGTRFDDRGFGKVSADGGGSSFDGTRFDGSGQRMAVADRESALHPHERALLEELFRDPDLRALDRAVCEADPFRQLVVGG